jgi:dTDP-4-dehydrorhamnose reductase
LKRILERSDESTPEREIVHVSSSGETNWAEVARFLAAELGVARCWEEVDTAALAAPAARPENCLFRHRALEQYGVDVMPDWKSGLREFLVERG